MTLEQISDASQAIAAIAVVVSLVFVGIQLWQNTEQGKQANRLARAQVTAEIRKSFNDLFRRAIIDVELMVAIMALSDHARPIDERRIPQLASMLFNLLGVARQAHELYRSDLLDAWALRDVDQQLFHMISHPQLEPLYRAMVGTADATTVTDEDRAWVRHINTGLKDYAARSASKPYTLATGGSADRQTSSPNDAM